MIEERIMDSKPNTSDKLVLDNMNLDVADPATLERYRNSLRALNGGHPWLELKEEKFMEVIGAAGYGTDGKLHPTGAGLLMFGKEYHITDEYPDYFLDYREDDGTERGSYRLQSQSGEWSGNIFDFFTMVTERLSASIVSPFGQDGSVRKENPEALAAAVETTVNALIHSDYDVRRGVVIRVNRNTVEVSNPGTFRVPLPEAIDGGVSDPRNCQIMKMFSLIGLAERVGSGLFTIFELERGGAIWYVEISESYNPSRVTVKFDLSPDMEADDTVCEIINILRTDSSATVAIMAERMGLSEKTVSRILSELKTAGKIVRVGSNRKGHWEFI